MGYIDYKLYQDAEVPIKSYTGIDLTDADKVEFHVLKPDETEVIWTANAHPDDPKYAQYHLTTGDIDQAGTYIFHVYYEEGTVKTPGIANKFQVHEKYDQQTF